MRSPMSEAVRIVAGQEVRNRVRTRAWRVSAAILLAVIIGGGVLVHVLSGRTSSVTVAVDSDAGRSVVESVQQAAGGDDYRASSHDSARSAEAAVSDGDADLALVGDDGGPWTLIGEDAVDPDAGSLLAAAVAQRSFTANADRLGVDPADLTAGAEVDQRVLDPQPSDAGPRRGAAFTMALIFYIVALLYGLTIAQSVVSEKESRVVEILAAAVPTRSLLWGKILGNSALALAQITVMVVAAFATLAVLGDTALLGGIGPALAWLIPFFALGFAALAAMWSAAGAMASRNEDIATTSMPMQMVLVGAYMFGGLASGTALTIGSFVPIFSALVMPSRIAQGPVPLWQILLALAVNALFAWLLVRLGAALYDRSLMQTSRKVGFREALRSPVDRPAG